MLKSKFFRIAVEGDTTDGRKIDRDWLVQMAKNYSQDKYGARIWCEHLRGYMPEGAFGAYGDVLEVKTEEVDIEGEKKLALFASISPTPELVALNQKRQKLFTSMEVDTDFADSGEAYLVGLAVTDSPASLGTEMLQFAAKSESSPLSGRKLKPENLFSVSIATELEFKESDESPSVLDLVKGMFSKRAKVDDISRKDMTGAIEAIAGEVVALSKRVDNSGGDSEQVDALKSQIEILSAKADKGEQAAQDLASLRTELEKTGFKSTERPPASGGKEAVLTDC